MQLTKTSIAALSPPAKGYVIHWCDKHPNFGVRVMASGAKSYVVQRRVKGEPGSSRVTLCRAEHKAPEEAWKDAQVEIGKMLQGINPKEARVRGMTLARALDGYIEAHELKPRTQADMRTVMRRYLKPWMQKAIHKISPDMVARKHRAIGEASKAQANLAMKYLRAVLTWIAVQHTKSDGTPIITINPVSRLSQTGAWFRVGRRRTVIKSHQLRDWFNAVSLLPENARDFLLFSMFTGLRPGEAATLAVVNVDMKARTFTVTDTKVHRPHTLPVGGFVAELLQRRITKAPGEYVFPGLHGKGHIKSVESAMRQVTADTGIEFCRNDLRRTFITIAESLDIPAYALKRLLNHSTSGDVTAGYIVTDVERLRTPMQRIEDYILKAAGQKQTADVVQIEGRG